MNYITRLHRSDNIKDNLVSFLLDLANEYIEIDYVNTHYDNLYHNFFLLECGSENEAGFKCIIYNTNRIVIYGRYTNSERDVFIDKIKTFFIYQNRLEIINSL